MRVLFISSQFLFSNTRFGGAKRLYYFARELERVAKLTLVCMDGCRELDGKTVMPNEFARQLCLPMSPPRNPLGRLPLMVDARDVFEANRDAIASFIGTDAYDVTLLAFPFALRFLDRPWAASLGRVVYMEDDLLMEQFRIRAHSGPWSGRVSGVIRYYQFLRFFAEKVPKLDGFIGISQQEEEVVRRYFPTLPTHILGYGLPMDEYPQLPATAPKTNLGFIGNYRHAPNLDALKWLVDDLFPFLRSEVPGARLILAGKYFPSYLRDRLAGDESIWVLDEVEELRDFYGSVGVFVNPIREGRGMRTKVIEAAAFGRPVLSTLLGAESMEDMDIGLWSDRQGLLRALLDVLPSERYAEMVIHNRKRVEERYSLPAVGRELTRILAG